MGESATGMTLDRYHELDPAEGEVLDAELAVTDDVLVKVFALGPGGSLEPHAHEGATNIFHVLEGTVTVLQGEDEATITAPGVIMHERGVEHGARNDTAQRAVFTASLCPLPG